MLLIFHFPAVRSWELREVLLEKIRRGQLTHLIVEDTFLSSYILDFVAEAAIAERRQPMQLLRCQNNMQDMVHNLFEQSGKITLVSPSFSWYFTDSYCHLGVPNMAWSLCVELATNKRN